MTGATSVTRRVLLPTLLITALVGAVAIATQMASIIADEHETARVQLERIAKASVPSLEQALWGVNEEQVQAVLSGLAQNPSIAHVSLVDELGRRSEFGERGTGIIAEQAFDLRHAKAGGIPLGRLSVAISDTNLNKRLKRRGFGVAVTLLLALAVTGTTGVLLFRWRVAAPLAEVTGRIERFSVREALLEDAQRPAPAGEIGREDEIGRLHKALEIMRTHVVDDVREIARLKDELGEHAARLESQVQERTAELEQRNLELEEKRRAIELLANTDGLTGAVSRRHFHELGGRELSRAARNGQRLAVMILDIDHFKSVNDAHGHAAGDLVLQAFARTCQAQLRGTDVLGRLGGEEFAVLLPDTDLAGASIVAERIRASVAGAPVAAGDNPRIGITVSIGIAARTAAGASLDALLVAADEALYAAKHGGRNRAVASDLA